MNPPPPLSTSRSTSAHFRCGNSPSSGARREVTLEKRIQSQRISCLHKASGVRIWLSRIAFNPSIYLSNPTLTNFRGHGSRAQHRLQFPRIDPQHNTSNKATAPVDLAFLRTHYRRILHDLGRPPEPKFNSVAMQHNPLSKRIQKSNETKQQHDEIYQPGVINKTKNRRPDRHDPEHRRPVATHQHRPDWAS